MNSDRDKFLPASSEEEALGRLLSNGLEQADTDRSGSCPGPEAIAAVVDGTAAQEERDRILKHVSACDECYEMFLLTAELQKEEQAQPGTHKIIRWKPLALAASLLVVVFSLYVFYRSSEIPKTPREMMAQSEAKEPVGNLKKDMKAGVEGGIEGGVVEDISSLPVGRDIKEAPQPAKPGITLKRERRDRGKSKAAAGGEKSNAAPLGFTDREEESKAAEKDALTAKEEVVVTGKYIPKKGMPEKEETELKEKAQEKQDKNVTSTYIVDGVGVSAKSAPPARKKEERDYYAKQQGQVELKAADESRHVQEESVSKKMTQRQSVEQNIGQSNAPIQFQAQQLNVMVQGVESYLPRKELENLFKDSIVLSQQLGEEYENVRQNAVTTGNYNEVKSYEQGLQPLINVRTVGNKTYISPNIFWFYSRSAPRTVEQQFFSLARAGWCAAVSQCYKEDKPASRLVGGKKRNHLLTQWQTLQPQLSGIFKEVATNTISHLEKTDK